MAEQESEKWEIETPHSTVEIEADAVFTRDGELHVVTLEDDIEQKVAVFAPKHWEFATKLREKTEPSE